MAGQIETGLDGFCSQSTRRSGRRFTPLLAVLLAAGVAPLAAQSARAANTYVWANSATTWNLAADWSPNSAFPGAAASDFASFQSAAVMNPNLTASVSAGQITFAASGTGYDVTSNAASISLQLNNNTALISAANTSGTNTIDVPLVMGYAGGNNGIQQASGGTLVINGKITSANAGITLLVTGSSGTTEAVSSIVKLTNSANTFTGGLTIGGTQGGSNVFITSLGTTGSNSSVGTGSINLGLNSSNAAFDGITYVGAGETATKSITLQMSTGSAFRGIDTTGATGAFILAGNVTGITATTGTQTLQLNGTNNLGDAIQGVIADSAAGGKVAIQKVGSGTWTLSGLNTYTGGTQITGGTLIVDDNSQIAGSSILASGSIVTLGTALQAGSATLQFNGKASTNSTQTLGAVTFQPGASHINLNAGSGGTMALSLGSLNATATGSTLDLGINAGTSVTTTTTSNAIDATHSGLFVDVVTMNGTDFATNQGVASNAIVGLSTISGAYLTSTAFTGSQTKALDVQGNTSVTGSAAYGLPAIRFNLTAANTLSLAPAVILDIGQQGSTPNAAGAAILVTSNVKNNLTLITGGTITAGFTTSGKTLALVQNNTQGNLQIDSVVADYSGTVITNLAKSGPGTAVLTAANTYTGATYINEGVLQFVNRSSLYNANPAKWLAANINVANGATLALNIGGGTEFTAADAATLEALGTGTSGLQNGATFALDTSDAGGSINYTAAIANTFTTATLPNSINFTKLGTGILNLTAASNTYTGTTTVQAGTLALTAASNNSIASSKLVIVGDTLAHNSAALTATGLNTSTFTIAANQTLAGFGTINGNVASAATTSTIAPGNNSNGTLTVNGNLTLGSGKAAIDLAKTAAGSTVAGLDYDQIIVTSANTLSVAGGTLAVTLNGNVLAGDVFYIVDNQGAGTSTDTGTFSAATLNGAATTNVGNTFTSGLASIQVSYDAVTNSSFTGGGGNDIALTIIAIPEPTACVFLGLSAIGLLTRRKQRRPASH